MVSNNKNWGKKYLAKKLGFPAAAAGSSRDFRPGPRDSGAQIAEPYPPMAADLLYIYFLCGWEEKGGTLEVGVEDDVVDAEVVGAEALEAGRGAAGGEAAPDGAEEPPGLGARGRRVQPLQHGLGGAVRRVARRRARRQERLHALRRRSHSGSDGRSGCEARVGRQAGGEVRCEVNEVDSNGGEEAGWIYRGPARGGGAKGLDVVAVDDEGRTVHSYLLGVHNCLNIFLGCK